MSRQIMLALAAAVAFLLAAGISSATLIVDPPQAITKQITVQLIRTALTGGTSPATVFGSASQRADIEAGIDSIWAQAGIDINILPTITNYNNTFAYQGNAGSGTRPSGDLNTMFTNAATTGGILNADSLTLNLIMVNVVPNSMPFDEDTAAGYARISGNGINGYVGDNLLTFENGRDVISKVMAHEIGHNLGLNHSSPNGANLMATSGSTSQQLTASQITTARSSNFARLFTPSPIAGDYNKNGMVDGGDYAVWRNTLNQSGSGLAADGNNNGSVDSGDYTVWRTRFGSTSGAGAGANVVPELHSIVYVLLAMPMLLATRRHLVGKARRVNPRVARSWHGRITCNPCDRDGRCHCG
jgi:hypothetical protein